MSVRLRWSLLPCLALACGTPSGQPQGGSVYVSLRRLGEPTTCAAEGIVGLSVNQSLQSSRCSDVDATSLRVEYTGAPRTVFATDASGAVLGTAEVWSGTGPHARLELAEGDCADGVELDGNGLVDCDDPECADAASCAPQEVCDNSADDDGDRLVDCADPGCGGQCASYRLTWTLEQGGAPVTCEAVDARDVQVLVYETGTTDLWLSTTVPCEAGKIVIGPLFRRSYDFQTALNLVASQVELPDFTLVADGPVASQALTFEVPTPACDADHLVISEIGVPPDATHPGDVYVELYNPTSGPLSFGSFEYTLWSSADGDEPLGMIWYSPGLAGYELPAHAHYLATGQQFGPGGDSVLFGAGPMPVLLEGMLQLQQDGRALDTVCWRAIGGSLGPLCEGRTIPFAGPGASALERLPGGAAGSCTDTDDNAADFRVAPRDPQATGAPPTP